jgi:hypothetical protein
MLLVFLGTYITSPEFSFTTAYSALQSSSFKGLMDQYMCAASRKAVTLILCSFQSLKSFSGDSYEIMRSGSLKSASGI